MKSSLHHWLYRALLGALILSHCVANAVWVHQDRTLRSFDMPPHLEAQLYVFSLFRNEGLVQGLARVLEGNSIALIWPATGYLPGAILAAIFGHDLPTIRLFNLLFLAITVVCVYRIGVRLRSRAVGLLAAALVTLYPLVYGESRQFSADFWGLAVTILGVLMLLGTRCFSHRGRCILSGLCVGLGLLLRPHSLLFLAGPALVLGCWALWRPAVSRRRVLLNMALCGGVALLTSVSWWWGKLGRLLGEFGDHAGGLESAFGHGPSLLFYIKALPWCFGWWLLLQALVAAVAWSHAWYQSRGEGPPGAADDHRVERWVIWAWLLGGLGVLSLVGVSHLRYLLPLCPALALLTARGLLALRHRLARRLVVAAALCLGLAGWLLDSFVPRAPPLHHLALSQRDLGDVVVASGPPRVEPLFEMATAVAEILAGRHLDGGGVFVRIFIGNLEGWEHRGVTGPLIMARLPGVVVSDDKMEVFFSKSRGQAGLGGTSAPIPCGEIRHHYEIRFGLPGRLPPPPPGPVKKIHDGLLAVSDTEPHGIRTAIWYLPGSLADPCRVGARR